MIENVIKRDGSEARFERDRIITAIYKAMLAVNNGSMADAKELTAQVIKEIEAAGETPTVEKIQDTVEGVLMTASLNGKSYKDVARAYIIYRERRRTIREEKRRMGVTDDMKLSLNAVKVLESRYLLKDEEGRVEETPREMFRRVSEHVGLVEFLYDYKKAKVSGKYPERRKKQFSLKDSQISLLRHAFTQLSKDGEVDGEFEEFLNFIENYRTSAEPVIETFENMMASLEFMPNSPTLMNAGTEIGQLSACFVLPVDDDIDGIFRTLMHTAKIHKSGGGTGFSFSKLRPKNDTVGSTQGVASGPVSFMRIFDVTTEVIKQGGKRRGANMAILRYDHPDIMEFINSKDSENTSLRNFNISVGVEDKLFKAMEQDGYISLINPKTGEESSKVKARTIWDALVNQAWKTADPGLIFLDEINDRNVSRHIGAIEATNPCGEQPLLPYESCNLGSINLSKFVKDGKIDYKHLREIIRNSVRFLDNVVDANRFPIEEIDRMTRKTRKIGLGYMGFADMLAMLKIPYSSRKALETAEEVMKFLNDESHAYSEELALERGVYPAWKGSDWEKEGRKMRNSTTTTIAPTGTISIISNCSSSIEPFFALAFVRHVLDGQELVEVNDELERVLRDRGLYQNDMMLKIAATGTLHETDLPDDIKNVFVTAHEIDPEWHVLMQATFQRFCDSGVSKTVNLPNEASTRDVEKVYLMAKDLHCKGITVYRDRSKNEQVLYSGSAKEKEKEKKPQVFLTTVPENTIKVDSFFDPACPTGKCEL
ncbi:MAG: adenosylcobalamin-dependent ribonucleoside-diphosphate reductase [Thermoplasmataceae archaeon]